MRIDQIHLQNFGCFDDHVTSFQPGFNVIKGPNEAGKSTLHRAILMALLERPSQKKATEPYKAWGEEKWYRLLIEYSLTGGDRYSLVKDFEEGSQELTNPEGEATKSLDKIQSAIEQGLGTASLNIFKSTVCVAQDEMTTIAAGQKEISQSLEQIITGGEEDVNTTAALKSLEGQVRKYSRGYRTHAPVNPGPIGQLQTKHESLSNNVNQYREQVDSRDSAGDEQRTARARLEKIESELKPRETLLENIAAVKEVKANLDRWREQEQSLEKKIADISEAEKDAFDSRQQLEALKPVSEASGEEVRSIALLKGQIDTLKTERERVATQMEELALKSEGEAVKRPSYLPPGIVTGIGLVGFFLGIMMLVAIENQSMGGIVAALSLILALFGTIWLIMTYLRTRKTKAAAPTVIVPEFDESELLNSEQKLNQKLIDLGCSEVSDLDAKWKDVQESREVIQNANARLSALVPEGQTKEELEEDRKDASRRRRDAEERLEEPGLQRVLTLDALQIQQLANKVSGLQSEKVHLNTALIRIAGKLEEKSISREDLLQAEEKLEVVEADLNRAKQRLAVYELAVETMREARSRTLKKAQDQMAPRLAGYLEKLTLGRFREVEVDSELSIRIRHPGNPTDMVPPDRLSIGTQDQLYLAARLALVDLLFPETNPPIFLDDPFVKFDRQRRQAAVELCKQIAEDRQVLLFTCSDHYDDVGHLIELRTEDRS
jgi:uncharacterized protein YhaN